ncbi:MAG: hypothetical protein AAF337_02585 [Pseudomonadota bacterium]
MRIAVAGLILMLAACGNEAEAPPAPDLPDPGSDLLIVFGQEEAEGKCAPYYKAYVKQDVAPELVRVATDMIINKEVMHGGGLGMQDRSKTGLLEGDSGTFGLEVEGTTCDQVSIQIRSVQCKGSNFSDLDCPSVRFEGTEQFAQVFEKAY